MYRYFEQVLPRKHGAPKPIFFPITSLVGRKRTDRKPEVIEKTPLLANEDGKNHANGHHEVRDVGVEVERHAVLENQIPSDSKLIIKNLTETDAKGNAVNDLCLHVEVTIQFF